jgi:hypothetical protein
MPSASLFSLLFLGMFSSFLPPSSGGANMLGVAPRIVKIQKGKRQGFDLAVIPSSGHGVHV